MHHNCAVVVRDCMDSKLSMQNQISSRDAEKSSTIFDVQKNFQDPLVQANLMFLIKLAKS